MKTKFLIQLALSLLVVWPAMAQQNLSAHLRTQLLQGSEETLNFPQSVKRLYAEQGYAATWVKPQGNMGPTWQAMLLLDCVTHFGLVKADYHPGKIRYDSLHNMMDKPAQIDGLSAAKFDILLSDAVITLINQLHYGKFNPVFTQARLDKGIQLPFYAEKYLSAILTAPDFIARISDVEPRDKSYQSLAEYMRLVKGQYRGDCYEVPEPQIRKVAVNMERLRWSGLNDSSGICINIPSYTLRLQQPDSTYRFKVIVGTPKNQTPILNSTISHFVIAPDWTVPAGIFRRELLPKLLADSDFFDKNKYTVYTTGGLYVELNKQRIQEIKEHTSRFFVRQSSGCDNALGQLVFRFPNQFGVYLHDTPDQKAFARAARSLSHGCIRVHRAQELAALVLKYDGAEDKIELMRRHASSYIKSDFKLTRPLPIAITYQTCEYVDGRLTFYDDIYGFDRMLEEKIYGSPKLTENK